MLEVACERAQAVVLDRTLFGLDAEKFKQFAELLDAPKVTNVGLTRLMDVKPPGMKATNEFEAFRPAGTLGRTRFDELLVWHADA